MVQLKICYSKICTWHRLLIKGNADWFKLNKELIRLIRNAQRANFFDVIFSFCSISNVQIDNGAYSFLFFWDGTIKTQRRK